MGSQYRDDPAGSTPDAELAALAAGGDRPAFDRLFLRHRENVRRVIHLRVRDDALTDELVQRAFVRAFEGIASFRGDAAFSTWLYTIATNVVRNEARERPADRNVPIDDVDLITTAFGTNKLIAREVKDRLAGALAELSPKQRMVVELHLLHGMQFKDVAAIADCSEESARRNYSHAVKRLRDILIPPDDD
jgi:RNA polymerase sigma-70 factor, ECF subfamily